FIINIKEADGGYNFNKRQKYFFSKQITTISACIMLIQTQLQSSITRIYNCDNEEFKAKWLQKAYQGQCKIGLATAHLKILRPLVVGTEHKEHFLVNGNIHFFTGYNIFNYMLLGFIANNLEYIALVPIIDKHLYDIKHLDLLMAKSTNTVSFCLKDYTVAKDEILAIQPIGTHVSQVNKNLVGLVAAVAAMAFKFNNLLKVSSQFKNNTNLQNFCQMVDNKLAAIEETILSDKPVTPFILIRAELLILINDCIVIAEQVYKGSAMIQSHPLNLLKLENLLIKSIAANDNILDYMLNKVSGE
ncbi:MAG: hypothetical protein ORN24_02755, partial [Burkholderiales bacterium]|nr:hypothetical protein [Burkholderiales bacterium]